MRWVHDAGAGRARMHVGRVGERRGRARRRLASTGRAREGSTKDWGSEGWHREVGEGDRGNEGGESGRQGSRRLEGRYSLQGAGWLTASTAGGGVLSVVQMPETEREGRGYVGRDRRLKLEQGMGAGTVRGAWAGQKRTGSASLSHSWVHGRRRGGSSHPRISLNRSSNACGPITAPACAASMRPGWGMAQVPRPAHPGSLQRSGVRLAGQSAGAAAGGHGSRPRARLAGRTPSSGAGVASRGWQRCSCAWRNTAACEAGRQGREDGSRVGLGWATATGLPRRRPKECGCARGCARAA